MIIFIFGPFANFADQSLVCIYLLSPEVEADLVGVFEVVVVGISFRPRIGLLVGTSVAEFFLGNFETGR